MCMLSVITAYPATSQYQTWGLDALKAYLESVEAAKKFDEVNNEPDCVDPEKALIIQKLEARVAELEVKLDKLEKEKTSNQYGMCQACKNVPATNPAGILGVMAMCDKCRYQTINELIKFSVILTTRD